MDVEALYPSIDTSFACEKCEKLLLKSSDLDFAKVDYEEIGLFLAFTNTPEQLSSSNFTCYCPSRKTNLRQPPLLMASSTSEDREERWKSWLPPRENPPDDIKRRMVIRAIMTSVETTMRNHVFIFDQEAYHQTEGGAIGVGLAGEVANLFMVWWDRTFIDRVKENEIDLAMYGRYVDDTDVVVKSIDENAEAPDRKTMERLQEIANAIHPSIRVTIDYPSNHPDNRLPVLDIAQWIGEIDVNGESQKKILHSHFMKEMSNRLVIRKDSALCMRSKLNILVTDLVRVMRNVSTYCPTEERDKHVQYYVWRMQYSGYTSNERLQVYRRAKGKYMKMLENHRNDTVPLYRSKLWNKVERSDEKLRKKRDWYKQGGYDSVMFVDATPGGELMTTFESIIREVELPIRIVERSGDSVKEMVVKSNPFKREPCVCEVCQLDKKRKVNCKSRELVYELTCDGTRDGKVCGDRYIGETSRSLGERVGEHINDCKGRKEKSVLWRHFKEDHNEEEQPYGLKVVSTAPGDCLLR